MCLPRPSTQSDIAMGSRFNAEWVNCMLARIEKIEERLICARSCIMGIKQFYRFKESSDLDVDAIIDTITQNEATLLTVIETLLHLYEINATEADVPRLEEADVPRLERELYSTLEHIERVCCTIISFQ